MSSRRQKDLTRIAATIRRLESNTSSGQSDEIDPKLVELYDKLEKAGRLDLLDDALTALISQRDQDDEDSNIELGSKT
ncbi:hypothetical protein GC175_28370 [bacterium]|nr:hypothetical protein [bacterium]